MQKITPQGLLMQQPLPRVHEKTSVYALSHNIVPLMQKECG